MVLPPDWCTLHGTSEEVEDGTNGNYMAMDVQLIPMRVRPLLLLRSRHTDPKQIWVGCINGINDSLVVLIRELRLIQRRISHHLQVKIIHGSTLHNQVEHRKPSKPLNYHLALIGSMNYEVLAFI